MATRMFKEVNVDVYRVGPPSLIVINWVWEDSTIPLDRYRLDIYRGESPQEMERIVSNLNPSNTSKYEDQTAKILDLHRTYYYEIKGVDTKTGREMTSELVTWEGKLDFVGLYVVEEHDFLFRHICGSPILVYKKQTDGKTRCTNCWDSISKRVTRSNCTICHGTGWQGSGVGGFYDPTYTWADLSPDPEIISIAQWGRTQPTQTDIFATNYPRFSVGDLVIELMTNKRWKVERVGDTEKRRKKMLQLVRLDRINPSDVEYKIDVPEEFIQRARKEYNERDREPEF